MPNQDVMSKKAEIISEIQSRIEDSRSVYFFNYRGLSAQSFNELRAKLREVDAQATVFKNTFIKRALENLKYSPSGDSLKEPTVLLSCKDDIVTPAKVLVDFVKNNEIGVIKGGYLADKPIDFNEIKQLSNLPTRDELLAKVVGSPNAPISNFVQVLSGVNRSLVCVLNAIKDQKEGGN